MGAVNVRSVILEAKPEKLVLPVSSLDHSGHIVHTALMGYPQLAADHLFNREMRGSLVETVGNVIRQLNLEFVKSESSRDDPVKVQKRKILVRQRAYETLIEIEVNLAGVESRAVGFSDEEMEQVSRYIRQALETWEALEKGETGSVSPIAKAVVEKLILDMKKVMGGAGMVAKMGEEIEKELREESLAVSFVSAAKRVIQGNVYYQMTTKGMCKFGNDYALGLRWLRHLGYVQVSTNPVLAARAYDDDPCLWEDFKEVAKEHKEWFNHLDDFGDEIAMQATMIALWPNLAIYRLIALLRKLHGGVVSYQLNPNVASSVWGSMKDGLKIYSAAQEFLHKYDAYLAWGYSNKEEWGRPNIVFKVAGESPAAIEITAAFNRIGIGTNNTVTYAVSQEVALILAALRGMAEALRMGIHPTQDYETNMGGRLESHLRDLEAEKILKGALDMVYDKEGFLRSLAEKLGALKELDKSFSLEEKVRAICSFMYLKSLANPAFVEAVALAKIRGKTKEETAAFLASLEGDIGLSGTFVARRVYKIFFSPENRFRWLAYLQKEFGVSQAEAEEAMEKMDVLPASKRKPSDTYLTLGRRNMTTTEFPNHQQNVLEASRQKGFNLNDFDNAVMEENDPQVLQRLLKLEDFRRAYELTPELAETLRKVGIQGDYGQEGIKPSEWPTFGSVVKTMNEFTDAYNQFKKEAVKIVREVAKRFH
jgi:hypothetical protein